MHRTQPHMFSVRCTHRRHPRLRVSTSFPHPFASCSPTGYTPSIGRQARSEKEKLPAFLDAYRQYPGLSVHWVLVGPSGRRNRPATGGVLRHYPQCAGTGHAIVKTIANTYFLANVAAHPHNFEFRHAPTSVYALRVGGIMCSGTPPTLRLGPHS